MLVQRSTWEVIDCDDVWRYCGHFLVYYFILIAVIIGQSAILNKNSPKKIIIIIIVEFAFESCRVGIICDLAYTVP